MVEQYKKPYFDSSIFLSWIKKETNINGVNRWERVEHIMKLAEQDEFSIYTSTLTLAEVYKLRQGTILPEQQNQDLLDYFQHHYIELVDVDRSIAEQANRLSHQYRIFPNDAIHLACALRAGCDFLLAWDDRFINVNHSKIKIEEPEIRGQSSINYST